MFGILYLASIVIASLCLFLIYMLDKEDFKNKPIFWVVMMALFPVLNIILTPIALVETIVDKANVSKTFEDLSKK